jgi:hydrogenase maturation factor
MGNDSVKTMDETQPNTARRIAAGKVEWAELAPLLQRMRRTDGSLRLGPGRGLDAAVLEVGGRVLVTATDPVTFATVEPGTYAVVVNANDVAVLGARPRWFQVVCLLADRQENAEFLDAAMAQIETQLDQLGAVLIGGHSEVVAGLQAPMLVGQMIGEALDEEVVSPAGGQVGDAVLLAGGVGIEATALVARELPARLRAAGLAEAEIAAAAAYLHEPGISVVRPALTAAATGAVTAMHDVTEGGVATAALELSEACGCGIALEAEALPVTGLTEQVLDAVSINPLGAIGSGGLLLCCAPQKTAEVCGAVQLSGVDCAPVGRLVRGRNEKTLHQSGRVRPLPRFRVDEYVRVAGESFVASGATAAPRQRGDGGGEVER